MKMEPSHMTAPRRNRQSKDKFITILDSAYHLVCLSIIPNHCRPPGMFAVVVVVVCFLILGLVQHFIHQLFHHVGGPHTLREAIGQIARVVVKVNDNGMIHQIIVSHFVRLAHVDAISFGHLLHLRRRPRQKNVVGMKIGAVILEDLNGIPGRIDRNKDGDNLLVEFGVLLFKRVQDAGHLVHFRRANVGTAGKPKVEKCPFADKTLFRDQVTVHVDQGPGTANGGFSGAHDLAQGGFETTFAFELIIRHGAPGHHGHEKERRPRDGRFTIEGKNTRRLSTRTGRAHLGGQRMNGGGWRDAGGRWSAGGGGQCAN
mmetsp:Transcript_9797/g.21193  ORF Transcript_9797/g.21193 Transcript_9797/m.21193 type:complete len:315 (+) Transcript_9797:6732-7676(+)